MVTKAKAGERIVVKMGPRDDQLKPVGLLVHPPCPAKDNGHWFCATHEKHLSAFGKDDHLRRGKHHLAWWCREHGIEQP